MATITTLGASDTSSTQVVKAADTSWAFFNDNAPLNPATGSYVAGPAGQPLGQGSAQLTVGSSSDGQGFGKLMHAGVRLDRITRLEYSSNQPAGVVAPALQIPVSYNGGPAWQGRLVFEPFTVNGTSVPGAWSQWNTLTAGKWWASGAPGNTTCTQASPCTWSQVLNLYPNLIVNPDPAVGGFLFKAGAGWTAVPFTGQVDRFTLGVDDGSGNITTTTYDFEPTPQCTTTCYVNATTGNDLNGGTSDS